MAAWVDVGDHVSSGGRAIGRPELITAGRAQGPKERPPSDDLEAVGVRTLPSGSDVLQERRALSGAVGVPKLGSVSSIVRNDEEPVASACDRCDLRAPAPRPDVLDELRTCAGAVG